MGDTVPGVGACGARSVARLLSDAGSAVFAYIFSHPTSSKRGFPPGCGPGAVTVGHTTEIAYVFNDLSLLTTPDDAELSTTMSTYWLAFARTGNPNSADVAPPWPAFNSSGDSVLSLGGKGDGGIRAQTGIRKEVCDWHDNHRASCSWADFRLHCSWNNQSSSFGSGLSRVKMH